VKSPRLAAILLLIAAGALALRLPRLDERPMHADESVHAVRFRDLWQQGKYAYDPNEFHGPTLVYATLPAAWLGRAATFAETSEATYRLVPVLFGTGVVVLLLLLGDALGKPAAVVAGIFTAVSPAMVYYSRYYIHEMLLVFFTLAAIAAGWRYFRSGRLGWCLAAGVCLGLMQATKETSVLVYFALASALVPAALWTRLVEPGLRPARPRLRAWHFVLGLAMAATVAVILYSSFFSNPRGPLDAALTYLPWLGRAGGASPHMHPWYEYLHRLGYWRLGNGPRWSEGLILVLAVCGSAFALRPKIGTAVGASLPFLRWLTCYTLILTAVYSVIPYKTPWCALGFLHGMILLAGFGAVALVRAVPTTTLKVLTALILLAATGQIAWQAQRAAYVCPADPSNPYVYAHTSAKIKSLINDVEALAEASPAGRHVPIKVIWNDAYYWPLPWYLRRFDRIELWTRVPTDPAAPLVIAATQHDAPLTAQLDATHLMTGYYEIRPQLLAQLWVRMDLWESHLRRLGRL